MTLEFLYDILIEALTITGFVVGMMILIEFINVKTSGVWSKWLSKSPWLQIIIGAIMGVLPGCFGTYTMVSLYVQRVVIFPALMATLVATAGDEIFFMFAQFPDKALVIIGILFVLAIAVGLVLQLTMKDKFIGLAQSPVSLSEDAHGHHHHYENDGILRHLWKHVIKEHLPKVFIWSFAIILGIKLLENYIDFQNIITNNLYIVLLLALLIGIIPQSGPHIIFVMLFAQGSIPFSILLANSIVQDGHGALPLIAESRKAFVVSKAIKLVIGGAVGILGIFSY